jgi:hypothetical protein
LGLLFFRILLPNLRKCLEKYIFCFEVNPDKNPEKKRKFHFEMQKLSFKAFLEVSQENMKTSWAEQSHTQDFL